MEQDVKYDKRETEAQLSALRYTGGTLAGIEHIQYIKKEHYAVWQALSTSWNKYNVTINGVPP